MYSVQYCRGCTFAKIQLALSLRKDAKRWQKCPLFAPERVMQGFNLSKLSNAESIRQLACLRLDWVR